MEINRLGDEHQMLRTEAGLGRAAMFGCGVKGVVVGVVASWCSVQYCAGYILFKWPGVALTHRMFYPAS